MKPNLIIKMMALSPKNKYKFRDYCVEVFTHNLRQMKIEETNFISSVQKMPLEAVAWVLCNYANDTVKLELVRIAMLFHIYRNEFETYLKNNQHNPKIKKALEVWKIANDSKPEIFKA